MKKRIAMLFLPDGMADTLEATLWRGTKEKPEILKESDYTVNEPSLKRAESPKPASKQSYKHVYDPLEEEGSPF